MLMILLSQEMNITECRSASAADALAPGSVNRLIMLILFQET